MFLVKRYENLMTLLKFAIMLVIRHIFVRKCYPFNPVELFYQLI